MELILRMIFFSCLLAAILSACANGANVPVTANSASTNSSAGRASTALTPTIVVSTSTVSQPTPTMGGAAPSSGKGIMLTSPAFLANQSIPKKFSCDGQSVSPELDWSGAPQATVSYALIVDDPDAPSGTFTHWVLYNIPAALSGLPEGVKGVGSGGANGRGQGTYTGPCPPAGKPHHYQFKLYATDLAPNLAGGMKPADLMDKLQGHILAQGELIGLYQR